MSDFQDDRSAWLRCYRCWSQNLEIQIVVGGIIPVADAKRLREAGVAGVYTPKDFDVNKIMSEIVELVGERSATGAAA
jgi:(2R)-ethylmalonyl-CoA mutase